MNNTHTKSSNNKSRNNKSRNNNGNISSDSKSRNINNRNIKNSLVYFWVDYKWLIMAGLVMAALAVYLLLTAVLKKDSALYVMLIDAHTPVSESSMESDALKALELDPGQYSTQVLNSLMFTDTDSGNYAMSSLSRFMADIGSGKLDVCAMREDDFIKYDESGTWADLKELFGEEDLPVQDENDLLIVDGRVIGIYTDALPALEGYECYPQEDCRGAVGIVYNAPDQDNAVRYLRYLSE